MHIVDGALSLPVLIGGGALTTAGVAVGLRSLQPEHIPRAAMLSAVFFVASLLHVPFGVNNVHLVLNGLLGIMLGWVAFPVLLIALLLQAVFFGFGGLLVLGVNTFNMALPAVICCYLCRPGLRSGNPTLGFLWGMLAGALAVLLSSLMVGLSLALSGQEFRLAAHLVVLTNLPVMAVDGLLTGAAVVLMQRVKPEVFQTLARVPVA
jgi:cobalt/nickel transport system permease protein